MTFERKNSLNNDLIIVDGLWGTGKSLISPIISCFKNIEVQKIKPEFEYLLNLQATSQIDNKSLMSILLTLTDTYSYNSMISREVNFRSKDFTSVLKNKYFIKYFSRLFKKDGQNVYDKINKDNIGLHLDTHIIFQSFNFLNETFKERLKFIEIVRHPLFLIEHWLSYFKIWNETREMTSCFYYNDVKIPWFAIGFEDEYISYNDCDRVLFLIIKLYNELFDFIDNNKSNGFIVIPFEMLTFNTNEVIQNLEIFLSRNYNTNNLTSILKEQKIPRKNINNGIGFEAYGWKKSEKYTTDLNFLNKKLNYIKINSTSSIYSNFLLIVKLYENKWPSKISIKYV